jgi:hypothetical protein
MGINVDGALGGASLAMADPDDPDVRLCRVCDCCAACGITCVLCVITRVGPTIADLAQLRRHESARDRVQKHQGIGRLRKRSRRDVVQNVARARVCVCADGGVLRAAAQGVGQLSTGALCVRCDDVRVMSV